MAKTAKTATKSDAFLREVRAFGLGYPGASLKSPWPDHCDLAVNDKTFAYLSIEGEPFGISCKLPQSSAVALMLPNAEPTGYGLGKSGWVTVQYAAGEVPPIELVKAWIDESYRAQAPKKLIAVLDGGAVKPPRATKAKATATMSGQRFGLGAPALPVGKTHERSSALRRKARRNRRAR